MGNFFEVNTCSDTINYSDFVMNLKICISTVDVWKLITCPLVYCMEALIKAEQGKALVTLATEAGLHYTRKELRYLLRNDVPETVQHTKAGCEIQTGKVYMKRYDHVAGMGVQEHLW